MEKRANNQQLNNLLILGAGGHGQVVKETALDMRLADGTKYFAKVDFLDDNPYSLISIGLCKNYKDFTNDYAYAFVSFGNNELRKKWLDALTEASFNIPVLIHPSSYISPLAKIAQGSIIEAKAVVNTNVEIERGCILGIGSLIDHDCYIGECSHIDAGAVVKAGHSVPSLYKIDAGVVFQRMRSLSTGGAK